MRFSRAGLIPLALTVSALAACAGGPGMGPGGPRPGPEEPLFISPFGEPFMGEPGAAWPVAEWFAGADANADGALTFAEFEADGHRWFVHLDSNEDGRIGYAELAAYEQGLAGLRGAQRGGPGGPGGQGGPGGGGRPPRMGVADSAQDRGQDRGQGSGQITAPTGGTPQGRGGRQGYGRIAEAGFFNLPQPVKGADVNIDQQVTGEEWGQAVSRWFLALDTDRDGKLTLETLPHTPLQQRSHR
ncbi:MAG: hypothetical protein V4707_02925 [Pseudomonadota bacterium]